MADKSTKTKKATESTAPSGRPVKSTNPERYRLRRRYREEIVPQLMAERGYKNVNQVPKIEKVVLNMRLGDIKDNSKSIQLAQSELEAIAGQKSILVKAKKSVSNFKLREGQSIAIKVTLRGEMAYEFIDKLVSVALPRVRDFRGISGKSFDGRGNYAVGIKDQTIFPEISYELIEKIRGFDVDIVTTAETDEEAKLLLTKLGMPFKN
ncbi:MAG: 50S ribosomal protein L5 [Clostridiales bacterium]|nr:50S ribosomal protein L5 [Clostridiales bacterium]